MRQAPPHAREQAQRLADMGEDHHEQPEHTDALDRLKAPAGLDIGAETQEEIALSIMAEIAMTKSAIQLDLPLLQRAGDVARRRRRRRGRALFASLYAIPPRGEAEYPGCGQDSANGSTN